MTRLSRRRLAVLLALLPGAVLLAFVLPPDEPPEMRTYWFALLRRGPSWTAEPSEQTAELGRGHMATIERLGRTGELVLAGPFLDGGDAAGLLVYAVETEEQARALAQSDPAVAAGRLVVELRPWLGPTRLATLFADRVDLPRTTFHEVTVEAACGQCQLGLPGEGCTLAVRLPDGRALFVEGTAIDEHGDAHAPDGFCNAVRRATVSGHVAGERFVASAFALLGEG